MNKPLQLSLEVKLDDQATFDNFYAPRGTPQHLATFVLQDDGQKYAYLVGADGSGLSHLLQAACQKTALGHNAGAVYMPLTEMQDYPPEQVLENLESASLLCLDDLQSVVHKQEWQEPLFNLFNRCMDAGTKLVIAAHAMPDDLDLDLDDLLSRLKSGVLLQMLAYKDADQRRLLQHRANRRGLYLSDEVALFLLNRLPRNSHQLMEALEKLDGASMQEQRRLTTPFVKSVLQL
ncbi:MAG: DnaA regulatory inactivator Hda [Porticoccaceae bacterium]|nr:DnaA regulatory inactivator Hda [Porticoccaceae bacterium]MDG1485793.1 DnaA regulatory inactivator Hda [Porticoccaceae bacterium]